MNLTFTNVVVGFFLLYAGPDQILPIVSILGTIIGVLLIWWQRFIMLVKKSWRFVARRIQSQSSEIEATKKGLP